MAKRDPTADLFRELRVIERQPDAPEAQGVLRRALASPINVVVSRAAPLVAEGGWRSLVSDLEESFEFFRLNPERDPDSITKIAIVQALLRLGRGDEIFLAGISHVQMQYGKIKTIGGCLPVDGGADLREAAIIALAERDHPRVATEVLRLLLDPYYQSRRGAIKALTVAPIANAHLVLRFKAMLPETEPEVIAETFSALLRLDPEGVGFVSRYLAGHGSQSALLAALALGESGDAAALPLITEAWKQWRDADDEVSEGILLAIATLRLDDGLEFLLAILRDGNLSYAERALEALGVYRRDADVCMQIRDAAVDSGVEKLAEQANLLFPRS